MTIEDRNNVLDDSFEFSLALIQIYMEQVKEHPDARPLLLSLFHSGVKIGMLVREAQYTVSMADRIEIYKKALVAAIETKYQTELLQELLILEGKEYEYNIYLKIEALITILSRIINKKRTKG